MIFLTVYQVVNRGCTLMTPILHVGDNTDTIQLHLNQDLKNVQNWLSANKLTLNMTTTEFLTLQFMS